MSKQSFRSIYVVLGDQLSLDCVLDDQFEAESDTLWMAESKGEAKRAWSHKARLVYFLSAMRHFRDDIRGRDLPLIYHATEDHKQSDLSDLLVTDIEKYQVERVVLTRPGDYRLFQELKAAIAKTDACLLEQEDSHFYTTPRQFSQWADGRKVRRMEHFYREVRRREGILVDDNGKPEGGEWNYDSDNQKSFGKDGPPEHAFAQFPPDQVTEQVIALVNDRYSDHPGSCDEFDWPVTRQDARKALQDFVDNRLQHFGDYQDAIWVGQPYLFHSRLSAAMNLHLLDPREVVAAVCESFSKGKAPINAVEGFVRQIIGWREFIRGFYWYRMPGWLDENALVADADLPEFFWTGETDMRCLADALNQTLRFGYSHHIQRLMVTGLYCLLLGVQPRQVHQWYHAIYVDAVEWVELPNTMGMSQFADGGDLASKPYVASGAYIQRMSNACADCPYNPKEKLGDKACPFTTLYWNFLNRHRGRFSSHPRMRMQINNLKRLSEETLKKVEIRADRIISHCKQ